MQRLISKMIKFLYHAAEPMRAAWLNRSLLWTLVLREIQFRYKGSILGLMWALITPLVMLVVYTFVFSVVFKMRWGTSDGSRAEFALLLYIGLMLFTIFSDCLSRAPALIISNSNYIKKVVFPIEILPLVTIGSSLFHFMVSFVIFLVAAIFFGGTIGLTILLVPFLLIPFLLFICGIGWLLAALGVYFRDLQQITGSVVQVLMFMTPIFYPASALPDQFQVILMANPLSLPIEILRDLLYWHRLPNIVAWFVLFAQSILVMYIGFFFFQKVRKGFADVV